MVDRRNSFSTDDYVIGLLLQLSPVQEHVRITHPEKGELLVSPKHGRYISRISDVTGFFQAHKSAFTVTEIKEKLPPVIQMRRIEDLLWEATLHAAQGRLIDGLRKYDVVQFTRWPNLTRVPLTPNLMRICALLTRFPSGIFLGQIILDIEEAEMNSVCSAAHVVGIVSLLNRKIGLDTTEAAFVESNASNVVESKSGQFLGRLFSRLSGL